MTTLWNKCHLTSISAFTSNLSWKPHIWRIASRANCMLGCLKCNFSLAPVLLKLVLYKTLIGPKLQYAASIWDPGHNTLVVESIQNHSASFILLNCHCTARVASIKICLSLPSLSLWRQISRLCLFPKIYFCDPIFAIR